MTREQAAAILHPETSLKVYIDLNKEIDVDPSCEWGQMVNEACIMGAEALRMLDKMEDDGR